MHVARAVHRIGPNKRRRRRMYYAAAAGAGAYALRKPIARTAVRIRQLQLGLNIAKRFLRR